MGARSLLLVMGTFFLAVLLIGAFQPYAAAQQPMALSAPSFRLHGRSPTSSVGMNGTGSLDQSFGSEASLTRGLWYTPLLNTVLQRAENPYYSASGVSAVGIVPSWPLFGAGSATYITVDDKNGGVTHEVTALRGGLGLGVTVSPNVSWAGGGFYSAMHLLDHWYTSFAFKTNVTWLIGGSDAILLSLASPTAIFDYSAVNSVYAGGSDRHGLHDFRVGLTYFHQLYNNGPDFRLGGYYYYTGAFDGFRAKGFSTSLVAPDGTWTFIYELCKSDGIGLTHTFSATFMVGFDLGRLALGQSPLTAPPRVFIPERNMTTTGLSEMNPCGLLMACILEMFDRLQAPK